ncbi:MAG TPA: GNAT family N-acetyltransferase [Actinomycetota bacterium]|jgi:aminoglycoside 6'-N-acetyltransferase|nr:GNAT family N-acetyltransferase [Actinomycetota bacterium]
MRADPGFEELRTPRLRLRRSQPRDAEEISSYRSDPDVHEHQGWDRTDPDHVRQEIEEMLQRVPGSTGGWVQFTVETLEDDKLVGDVGLRVAEDEPGVVMVGYTMAPAAQGKGYATEAVGALVDYAFGTLDAQIARAYADAANAPSVRVGEKVGLVVVERFDGQHEGETWHGVRMERRRPPDPR